jgi:hypothetical protein
VREYDGEVDRIDAKRRFGAMSSIGWTMEPSIFTSALPAS